MASKIINIQKRNWGRTAGKLFVGAAVLTSGLLAFYPGNEQAPVKTVPTTAKPKKTNTMRACTEEITLTWEWRSLSWYLKSRLLLHQHVLRPALGINDRTPLSISIYVIVDKSGKVRPKEAFARCEYTKECPKTTDIFKTANIDLDKQKLPPPTEDCLFFTGQIF